MQHRLSLVPTFLLLLMAWPTGVSLAQGEPSAAQLARWLARFPDADRDGDGVLTVAEVMAYREKVRTERRGGEDPGPTRGAPRIFPVDPAWENRDFPEDAVFRKTPEEIASIYEAATKGGVPAVTSFEEPQDGAIRIVGTGHSFMMPGYRTFPRICEAAGFRQPLFTHTGGGITGSTRYKWEQENGIFQFKGRPVPKLLASIANAEWEAMMWGPYFNDRPQYYSCWIDFCLGYHPEMKFYLSDAWIQLYQLGEIPESEEVFTEELIDRLGREKREPYIALVRELREQYPGKVFILPTCDAMTIAAKHFLRGELPGVEGLHRAVAGKNRSLWTDPLGHLGPGFDRLEGYVFYATIYGRSPERIEGDIDFPDSRGGESEGFPSPELDRVFRRIAWQAVIGHELSGVSDRDGDGLGDAE